MPLLSIIVTCYNLETYIGECLDSILQQDFDDYELIVVDNGSDDKSVNICNRYAREYNDKMKFFALMKPTLPGRAHRIAQQYVTGRYVQFIDGDDCLGQNCLREIGKILYDKKPDALMGTFKSMVEPDAVNLNDAKICSKYINEFSYNNVLSYLKDLPSFHPVIWRFILKKEFISCFYLNKYLDIDMKYRVSTTDWATFTNILLCINSIYYYDKPFYFYRRRAVGAMTSGDSTDYMRNYFITFIVLLRLITKYPVVGAHLDFALSRLTLLLKNFTVAIDKITLNDFYILADMIDEYIDCFSILKQCGAVQLERLYSFITDYGSLQGLMLFCEYDKITFLASLPELELEEKEVYVFPTGIKGQATARLLKDKGIKVIGFFDNDESKQLNKVEGLPCYSPKVVDSFPSLQKEKSLIVIAPLYEQLNTVLTEQLKSFGIDEDNIMIRK